MRYISEAGHLEFNIILGFYPDQKFAFCIQLQKKKKWTGHIPFMFFVDFSNVLYFSNFKIFTIYFFTKYVNTFR